MNYVEIGKGSYGTTYKSGPLAIKKFSGRSELKREQKYFIQEVLACQVLKKSSDEQNQRNINSTKQTQNHNINNAICLVESKGWDLKTLCISYTLYDENFLTWIPGRTELDIMGMMKFVVQGLAEIHSKGFIHCDVKPENILVNKKDRTAVLCDFGLLCIPKLSRCDVNTPFYSETNMVKSTKRDIYSLGVTFLVALSSTKISSSTINSYKKILIACDSKIRDKSISYVVKSMVTQNPDQRPTAKEILSEIWHVNINYLTVKRRWHVSGTIEQIENIHEVFYAYTEKYGRSRQNKHLKALEYFILSRNIKFKDYAKCFNASFYIMSCSHGNDQTLVRNTSLFSLCEGNVFVERLLNSCSYCQIISIN